ncbi:MAG: beta-ketoacyl synthase chain length factor [Gammaproteobacteria bacterium]|nr:beta-ketoacyl synthase chain length factor [Gammaproteobacteria bacterium]
MRFFIESVAILSPGLESWPEAKKVFAGKLPYKTEHSIQPSSALIPANIERRCSASTLLSVHVAELTLHHSAYVMDDINAVFVSSVGDPDIDDRLCVSVAADVPMPSPILFHNSVHNAPAGYWSIATASQSYTNSLAAGNASYIAGFLSAYTQMLSENKPVMLVAYDQPLQGRMADNHILSKPFACSMLLTPEKTGQSLLGCDLDVLTTVPEEGLYDIAAEFEELYKTVPAARALPLLMLLAAPENTTVNLGDPGCMGLSLSCHLV